MEENHLSFEIHQFVSVFVTNLRSGKGEVAESVVSERSVVSRTMGILYKRERGRKRKNRKIHIWSVLHQTIQILILLLFVNSAFYSAVDIPLVWRPPSPLLLVIFRLLPSTHEMDAKRTTSTTTNFTALY